jgi:hypothetical protein
MAQRATMVWLVFAIASMAACSSQTSASAAPPTATALPTLVVPTATATPVSADGCPSPWPGEPKFSSAVLGGTVPLPAETRIIAIAPSPGAEDASLCTLDATAASISAFMTNGLKAKGWHFDSTQEEWLQNGSPVEISFSVSDPLNWDLSCICSGL